jgi:RNA recognition motif-containing protein
MDIYVGNLSYDTTDARLNEAFAGFGEVTRATVIKDRDTGRSRGFGFVEIADADQARAAVESLNGTELDGRAITVNEARPRSESRPRSGGGGGYGGGGGGGRY